MRFFFFSVAAILLPFASAAQECSIVDVKPAPAGYTCGGRGILATPKLLGSTKANTRYDCAAFCRTQVGCASLSMQGTSCKVYGKPLKQMGYKAAPKSGTLFYAASCFKQDCHQVDTICAGPEGNNQFALADSDQTSYLQFGGSYGLQLVWTTTMSDLPYFYIDPKFGNLCTGNKTLYWTGPEDSLHDPPYTMDLWKGSPLYLPEGARVPKCALNGDSVQCSWNGTQELFYHCPPSTLTSAVLLGSHNPNPNCVHHDVVILQRP